MANPHYRASPFSGLGLVIALVFCCIVAIGSGIGYLPMPVAALYLVISLITFIIYAMDKSAAKKNRWRTPEKTLHLFALFGGWPGAVVAQKTLRHKSRKVKFQIIFWVTALLNTLAIVWLFSPLGESFRTQVHLNELMALVWPIKG